MARAQRLLQLMQALRNRRYPVSAGVLAEELKVSKRTLYRDIGVLKDQGAHIDGEPGIGYVLKPGFMLPPLMFSEDEIDALVLGSRWVSSRADGTLAEAASSAVAKIAAVLPKDLRESLTSYTLLIPRGNVIPSGDRELGNIRLAIRNMNKVEIVYRDLEGKESTRIIWPFALGFFERVRIVAAWCETRQDYRHFRTDRIQALTTLDRYPRSRNSMLREWQQKHDIRLNKM